MSAPGHGFEFELDDELSEDDLVALIVKTPEEKFVQFYAEVEVLERSLVLRQFAIYGVGLPPRELGWVTLRRIAYAAMEEFDVDAIRIEEARRTTGSRPGRVVKEVEFRRRRGR